MKAAGCSIRNPGAGYGTGIPRPRIPRHGRAPVPPGEKKGAESCNGSSMADPIDRFEGVYRRGKREGFGRYDWPTGERFEGTYADDLPNGRGTATIDGVSFSGTWRRGCLVLGDKRIAIGVPLGTCGGRRASIRPNASSAAAMAAMPRPLAWAVQQALLMDRAELMAHVDRLDLPVIVVLGEVLVRAALRGEVDAIALLAGFVDGVPTRRQRVLAAEALTDAMEALAERLAARQRQGQRG